MRHSLTILAAMLLCATSQAQTMKSLMYNASNGVIAYSATNSLTFNNDVRFAQGDFVIGASGDVSWQGNASFEIETKTFFGPWNFDQPAAVRSNLGFATNLNTLWTATNTSNARSAVGLGATWLTNTNVTNFRTAIGFSTNLNTLWAATNVTSAQSAIGFDPSSEPTFLSITLSEGLDSFVLSAFSSNNRDNLGLGATNIVTFAGITNNGDIRINQTTPTNGLLYIRRTNNEPFLGLANLIASNNTTLSNETLFRVGRAEATNQAAQFGFRVVRTNNGGEGFATFSVFGYNALMMVGPSDRSRTNTSTNAGIEAEIYTITGSNRVMTLRDTNSGALTLHQDLGFGAGLTNNAPTNTNTPTVWLRVWVGTNNYRLPLYQ